MRATRLTLIATALAGCAALPALAADNQGFLYGKVTTREGQTYEGRLRWDDEEAFWGDYFNSAKEENPWLEEAPRRDRERKRRTIEVFGIEIGSIGEWEHDDTRQFIARFGDIKRIEPKRHDEVLVTMKSGTVFTVEGGANDVEAEVRVWDPSLGLIEVDWDRIRIIELLPTPTSVEVAPVRLHGTVKTREGNFTGYIQWDQEECLGSDELDGETSDGDVSIKMGTIRSIERRSGSSSTVVLHDGRKLVLSDTNDVDSSNRGIYVTDPRYGRVLVNWDAFERVDFAPAGTGPGYDDFAPGKRLHGTVTVADGRKLSGRLVYDLDESETTEMLDGHRHDVEYSVPFALVAAVVPRQDSARVILGSGEELLLEETTDVSEDNAGLLVFTSGAERPTYVRWEDVERVDFSPAR
jgi:hypothetical protein